MDELFRKIKIIYEDNDILVLNKPAGLVVTSEGTQKENTIQDWLVANYPNLKNVERNGIVHRLDKGTSGLLLTAKKNEAATNLKHQFKSRQVKKKYIALIGGDVSLDGEIKVPIKRSRYVFGRWQVDPDGKEAWTLFRLISKYKKEGKLYSLVEIDLKTGRTHQIRVHFSYLKWPLVGDSLYGGEKGLGRPFLQSKYLEFTHPATGQVMSFELPLGDDLEAELNKYEKC